MDCRNTIPERSSRNTLLRSALLLVPVLALAVLFLAAPAGAAHLTYATNCTECHSVANAEAEIGTSYISSAARTLPFMKALNGGSAPGTFGCTFCHFNDISATKKGVFSHFSGNTSMHPVGYDFSTAGDAPTGDTNGEYLTGWAPATLQADELDCVDCHLSSLLNATGVNNDVAYADHVTPGTGGRVGNPNMLVGGGSLTALCRSCHDAAAPLVEGMDVSVTSHGETALAESDSTPLKTSACADCHDTHYSNNFKLFNDGHEGDANIDMGNATQCSNIYCHERGDVNNNFDAHGHGMALSTAGTPMGFECGACHSVDARHDGATAKMFNFSEDPALSTFGKSLTSICYICHNSADYAAHGAVNVGCIDCHDEHAEGSGAASNIYMVPTLLPNNHASPNAVFFEDNGSVAGNYDYFRGTGDGMCDSAQCHSGVTAPDATPVAPLSGLMTAGHHTGGDQSANADCSGCHTHGDASGSWAASESCTSCHGQPPVSAATAEPGYTDHTENNSPHAMHALAPASGGYGFACTECHNAFTNGLTHDTGPNTYDSIWFDQTTNPQTTAFNPGSPTVTPNYNQVTETCTNLYCHSNGVNPTTSTGSQQWMSGVSTPDYSTVDLGCGACHGAPPASGSHGLHNTAGVGCENCHFATTTDGTTINLLGGQHVDRTKDLAAGGTFAGSPVSFTWGSPNCSNISCHGGYANVAWGAATSCANCHGTFAVGGMAAAVAPKHRAADWTDPNGDGATTRFDVSHRGSATGAGDGEEFCDYCHANTQGTYLAGMHLDGVIQLNSSMGYAGTPGPGGGEGCASACHAQAAPYQMNDTGFTFQSIGGQGFGCGACHNDGTVPPTSGAHTSHLDAGRGAAWTNSGDFTACEACHGLPPNGVSNTGWAAGSYDHNDATLAFANSATGNGETWDVTYNDQGTGPVSDDTCSTSECHSVAPETATWAPAAGAAFGASISCRECHYYEATPNSGNNGSDANPIGGSHNAHFLAGINSAPCTDCHGTAPTDNVHIDDLNVGPDDDRTVLVDMSNAAQDEATLANTALLEGGSWSDSDPGNPTCSNLSCHDPSNSGFTGTWTTASNVCSFCHVGTTGDPGTGAHTAHINYVAGYAPCTECHVNNSGNYDHTLDSPGVDFAGGITFAGNACTTNTCHDSGSDPQWTWTQGSAATITNCDVCHAVAVSDTNDFNGQNKVVSEIMSGAEWGTYGHGAKGVACTDCHNIDIAHDTTTTLSGANSFRLNAGFTCSDTSAGCHAAGTMGPATGQDISTFITHDNSVMSGTQRTWPAWDPQCLNCHDPHGDGANLSMVQRELYDKAAFLTTGVPAAAPTEQTNLLFTNDTTGADNGGASYADLNAPYSSVCQECHEDASMVSFRDNINAAGANHPSTGANPGDCTGCHPHSGGFAASGCSGCHGDGGSQNWPDSLPADVYEDREGAHNEHVAAIGTGNSSCDTCHPGNPPATHPDGSTSPARMINHDTTGNWAVNADAGSYSDLQGNVDDADGIYNGTTFTCRNIDCHGGVETPGWYGGAIDSSPPTWPSGDGLTVTDLVRTGFELAIDWNAADDETGPVTYELRRSTATFGGTCAGGTQVATGLGSTGYVDTFPSNSTTYYYCVNATDSAPPAGPYTAASTTNAFGSATEPSGGGACWVGSGYQEYPGAWTDAGTGSATTTYMASDTPGNIDCTLDTFCYYNAAAGGDGAGIIFLASSASGTSVTNTAKEISVTVPTAAGWNCTTPGAYTMAMTAGEYIGHYAFGVVSRMTGGGGYIYAGTTDNTPPVVNWTGTSAANSYSLFATGTGGPPPDSTPPAFGGLTNAVDQAKGGTVQLTWTATNDTGTGDNNPVVYRVWWSTSTNGNPAQGTHNASTTQSNFTVSGLTDSTPYFFLVRAEDSVGNIDTNVVELSATPTPPSGGGGGLTCTSCHDTAPTTGAHQVHANNDADYSDCDNCHGDVSYSPSGTVGGTAAYTTAGPAGSVHNDGTATLYFGAIPDDATWSGLAPPNDTCSNVNCHFNTTTPSWTTGSGDCSMCHGYPPSGAGGSTNHFARTGAPPLASDALFYASHSVCNTCHGISGNTTPPTVASTPGTPVDNTGAGGDAYVWGTHHANGTVELNGTASPGDGLSAEYAGAGTGSCNQSCHTTAEQFNGTFRTNTVNLLRLGGGDCRGCHDGTTAQGTSGVIVGENSPHADTATGLTCEGCHTAHGAGTIEIPNYSNAGITYGDNGESGISLGGSDTSGTTEAEICWNCHSSMAGGVGRDLSEWGTNADTNGASPNYNFGSLTTYNWFSANTWSAVEANFSYKNGNLTTGLGPNGASTHTANPSGAPWNGPTGPGVDAVAQVRCSYCHDVHDTMGPTGRPYLRGTWMGSPYPEDGAPWAKAYANLSMFGRVPRGQSSTNEMGGFQIDQNNGNPTSGWPGATELDKANSSSGLCELCHGGGNGVWTAGEINVINQFGGQADQWIGTTNGHGYVTLGGSLTGTNIFSTNIRNPNGVSPDRMGGRPAQAYQNIPSGGRGFGFRDVDGEGWGLAPLVSAGSEGRAFETYSWGATADANTVDPNYHQFPCSKCHNPHASRLPRLMITNCLDTSHNTWDGTGSGRPGTVDILPNSGTADGGGNDSMGVDSGGKEFSQATSAQNCHRMRDSTWGTSTGDGWNNITPW